MNLSTAVRFGLAALLAAAVAVPARAGTTSVSSMDGVILSYSATVSDLGGGERSLAITYNSLNFVTRVNGSAISTPLNAEFPTYHTTVLTLTPIGGGDYAVSLSPSPGGRFGVQNLGQVVLDYNTTSGNTFHSGPAQALSLGGSAALDPLSPATSVVSGPDTYDFSKFAHPKSGSFTLTLNSSQDLINDLVHGSGTFAGSASFSLAATPIPEPATVVLCGIAGVVAVAVRRRKP